MIIPAHGCRNVKTGLDWTETDYWLIQKNFIPSFLLSFVSDSVHAYIGWLFQSQPRTSSLVRDKYCLRSSTFHAQLPPPVPWPAKSEGWNSCQMPPPTSFEDDWKEVLSYKCFESISFSAEHKNKLWSRILKRWFLRSFKRAMPLFLLSFNCRRNCVFFNVLPAG